MTEHAPANLLPATASRGQEGQVFGKAGLSAGRSLMGSAPSCPLDAVPAAEAFARLPELERNEVRRWAAGLAEIQPPVVEGLRRLAVRMGVSYSATREKYYRWIASGRNAMALVNRARVREGRSGLSTEFVTEWHRRMLENQRNSRAAWRKLLRDYRSGVNIPGIPEGWDRSGPMPSGWSYSNLMKRQPSAYVTAAMRIGRTAAADHRPLVYTTRENLWVGSHYLFDDIWHDVMVNVLDTLQTGRPLEFHCLDLFSACKVSWGFRVRTENVLTGRMEGLREEHMRFLVTQVLMEHGFDARRGTVLVVEHGTAAIRPDLEELIREITGGRVTVARSGMVGDPAFVGQYAGRAKGNFRFKAALESAGSLHHNELADVAGQTGLSVARRPEELHGLLNHNDALLDAMLVVAQTRPDLAVQMRANLMTHTAYAELLIEVYGRINRRTEHRLEGWSRQVAPAEDRTRMRRLSPWEVWTRDRGHLTTITGTQAAVLLWKDSLAVERRVKRRMIEVWEKTLGPDPVRYDALSLQDGETYACLINPYAPHVLWAYDARGRFVAACQAIERADRSDPEAMERAYARAAHAERVLMDEVTPIAAKLREQRLENARHNAGILIAAGLGGDGAKRRLEERAATAGQGMAEMISREATPEPVVPDETLDVRTTEPVEEPESDLVDARDQ